MTSVFMACPVYDREHPAFSEATRAIANGTPEIRIKYQPYFRGQTDKARGILASHFLINTDYEWYLSADCDIQPSFQDIERLVSRGHKVIGGYYHKSVKGAGHIPVLNTLNGEQFDARISEVQEVLNVGTGLLLIHRSILEAMRDAHPELAYRESDGAQRWNLFQAGVFNGEYESCDWAFCRRARELGEKIYVDCGRKIPHHGAGVY